MNTLRETGRSPVNPEVSRVAFTLIETIIAMSLMTLLMAIVWTMFSVYTKLESKGVAAAKESALIRSIDRQLRQDLLHTVGIDTTRPFTTKDDSDQAANWFPINGYLIGTATDLHFVISSEPISADPVGKIRVISYEPRSLVGGELEDADPFVAKEPTDVRLGNNLGLADGNLTPLGIDRHERSWASYTEARSTDDSDQNLLSTNRPTSLDADDLIQVGPNPLLDQEQDQLYAEAEDTTDQIPEIQYLNFRYFDGDGWRSVWDSTVSGHLPIAIEVSFDLEMVDEQAMEPAATPTDGVQSAGVENQELGGETRDRNQLSGSTSADTITIEGAGDFDAAESTEYKLIVSVPAATVPTRDRESEQAIDSDGVAGTDQADQSRSSYDDSLLGNATSPESNPNVNSVGASFRTSFEES